ncbi:class I SAM-dependent methyltransferase [Cellulomonas hominis]|uniref:Class I SAM-dependent methyltransferase n=1 Tax=Cellulomonas hominis TaxID=156981 RepID=A0A7Z8JXE0_9CELL|nr:class I SAM-dependent methyltransferase [Cellulomonas hominis]TKR22912.1 class I SAM-dependent methyltransferase [Cellulomonas hominis]
MGSRADLDAHLRRFDGGRFDEPSPRTPRSPAGLVELARTRRLLADHLPPGAEVLDVGGGTAVHAAWLAGRGHPVTLADPVPEHVATARAAGGCGAERGDARTLRFPDGSFDAVLLLGPLHRLRDRADRLVALSEARRVLRPGGVVLAGAVSRVVAATDRVTGAGSADPPRPARLRLVERGEGPADPAEGLSAAHVHTAAELREEVAAAGFDDVRVTGVEAPGSLALRLVPPDDQVVAAAVVLAERAPGRPGAPDPSGHLLAVARR